MPILLFLDIETLPGDMTAAQKAALVADSVPGNYKDPEKIAAWIAANQDAAYRRTAFDWQYCRPFCLATAIDDADPVSVYSEDGSPGVILDGLHEAILAARAKARGASVRFVGHNVAGFDLPRLRLLAARERHPVVTMLPCQRYDRDVVDTMVLAGGTDSRMMAGLGDLAKYLHLEGKVAGLDGSKVYDAWLAGEHESIARYCRQDVVVCRNIYRALSGLLVATGELGVSGG